MITNGSIAILMVLNLQAINPLTNREDDNNIHPSEKTFRRITNLPRTKEMKIIEQGRNMKSENDKKCICSDCGCKFLYGNSDIQDIQDRNELLRYIVCPNKTCERRIYLAY